MKHPVHVIFRNRELLPGAWEAAASGGPLWCFNPSVLRISGGWLMAYRVVLKDGLRRIAICRLNEALEVEEGTPSPLSDHFSLNPTRAYNARERSWFADPRLFEHEDSVYVSWNTGWHEPINRQFVQALDQTLLACRDQARELIYADRKPLEKNWVFPQGLGGLCLYEADPFRLLRHRSEASGDWVFQKAYEQTWQSGAFIQGAGAIRGGANPIIFQGRHLAIGHCVSSSPCGYRYTPVAYSFQSEPPHAVVTRPVKALPLPNPNGPRNLLPRLNPVVGEVLYPSGAGRHEQGILVSYGINDEACALAILSEETILETQEKLDGGSP